MSSYCEDCRGDLDDENEIDNNLNSYEQEEHCGDA